jgi:hypothetical protein
MKLTDTPTIECHPPERRRRTEIRMCHGSCCCCCCCLHTVGGIVGAVIAPNLGTQATAWSHLSLIAYWEEEEFQSGQAYGAKGDPQAITEKVPAAPAHPVMRPGAVPNIAKPGISAVQVFWLLSLALTVLGAFIGIAQEGGSGFIVGLVILALVFPAVQLVSAILVALWLSVSARQDKWFQLRQVGKITLGLFLGTVAGILAMIVIGVLWSQLAR